MEYDDDFPGGRGRVADLRAAAQKAAAKLEAELGRPLEPAFPHGRQVARSFWGRVWCRHIESFQDYESRLPRGRSYLRNGAVLDLEILPGHVRATVAGSSLYRVEITVDPLEPERWKELRRRCAGGIGSLVDLIEGKLSDEIIAVLCDPEEGIFPTADEIRLDCNCPDWSDLCKHLAAVLYGVGARLDDRPELLFVLRGVESSELFRDDLAETLPEAALSELELKSLGETFGIELDSLDN